MNWQKIKTTVPFIILFSLSGLLAWELFYFRPNTLPSPLLGQTVPAFHLKNIYSDRPSLDNQILSGRVTLLNIWATWCEACLIEHPMLMKIKNDYHVPIYSINYKDNPQKAMQWLQENGNPYVLTGNDDKGDVAIDLGVYGTPETFVISPLGKIVYRHIGVIDQKAWDEVLYPLIKKYGSVS